MSEIKIKSVKYLTDVTGAKQTGKWDVYGTDLGAAVYSEKENKMYFLFGDTIGDWEIDRSRPKVWRGCVAGYTSNLDFTNGIDWDGFVTDEKGHARELVISHHCAAPHYEISKITQGGIEVNGNLYFFYESIHHWGRGGTGDWYINYGGVIKSSDCGKTFEKVHDLSWVEPTHDPQLLDNAARLVKEDVYGNPTDVEFDVKSHIAPGFGQDYPADGKDGYIYVYGRLGGRYCGIKLCRVKKENFETFSEYEYLTEYVDGQPVWKKYREGIDAIIANPDKADIVPGPTANMSVHYNEYLGKWLLFFYRQRVGIHLAVADNPYGPFTEPECVIPREHPDLLKFYPVPGEIPYNGLYGGFAHEKMNREGGKIVPILVSNWYNITKDRRFYGSRMFEIEFE